MKRVILPASVAAVLLATSAVAAGSNAMSDTALSAQVKQLSAQTKKLEREVSMLHYQMNKHAAVSAKKKSAVKTTSNGKQKPWPHFVTVTTTPFLGMGTDYDGDDLLYNVSSNNEDLRLLMQRQAIQNELAADGYTINRPILQVSGAVEGLAYAKNGFGGSSSNGVSLSDAELDFNAIASSWANAFMTVNYDGAPLSTGNREPYATIYLGRGFLTIGNLDKCPVYFTGGLMYVPFGRYANDMVSTPLTESLGKIRTPAALLGLSLNNGLRASIYGYSGYQTSGGQPMFKQWGLDSGYKHKFNFHNTSDSFGLGAGWTSNIADSQGMQNNGVNLNSTTTQFGGFGQPTTSSTNNNALSHSVNGIDVHGDVSVGRVSLIGEYLGADQTFANTDMSFDNTGAEPQAMHAEVDYLLPFFAKKYGTTMGFAYGQTWQALALQLPKNSYSLFLNTSIWRETTESIEFRHDDDYSSATTANGLGGTSNLVGTGKTRNSVLAQFGVYF